MKPRNTTAVLILAATLALGVAALVPSHAGARGMPGRGYDGERSGVGLYAGPLFDREPYGYGYRAAEAMDRGTRTDRLEFDRLVREIFERGYRQGRLDGQRAALDRVHNFEHMGAAGGMPRGDAAPMDSSACVRVGAPAAYSSGLVILLVEHGRQQQAMQDVRRSLMEARAALRENDRNRAEAALSQADQTLRMASPGAGVERVVDGWMAEAEQALRRGDRMAAQRSMQQALAVLRNQDAAACAAAPVPRRRRQRGRGGPAARPLGPRRHLRQRQKEKRQL